MRGIAGHPADTDRDTGFQKALAENPGITVVKRGRRPKWDPATATSQINDILASRHRVRRHLDVRHRLQHRRRAQDRQPCLRADRRRGQRRLRQQLLNEAGPERRRGHQPGRRRRRRRRPRPADPQRPEAPADNTVHVTPEHVGQRRLTQGKADLTAAADPNIDPALAARPDDPGLDHLHQGRDHRLQGPGRVARVTDHRRGSSHAGVPATAASPLPLTMDRRDRSDRPSSCSRPPSVGEALRRGRRPARPRPWPSAPARSTPSWARTAPARARSSRS